MTPWKWLRYENGMHHVVSEDLVHAVLQSMAAAVPPGVLDIERSSRAEHIGLELGGPATLGRPREEITFEGLKISIPSEDLSILASRWVDAVAVVTAGKIFYLLTSWPYHCLTLDPGQHTEFLKIVCALIDSADRRTSEFYESHERPEEALRRLNVLGGAFSGRYRPRSGSR